MYDILVLAKSTSEMDVSRFEWFNTYKNFKKNIKNRKQKRNITSIYLLTYLVIILRFI